MRLSSPNYSRLIVKRRGPRGSREAIRVSGHLGVVAALCAELSISRWARNHLEDETDETEWAGVASFLLAATRMRPRIMQRSQTKLEFRAAVHNGGSWTLRESAAAVLNKDLRGADCQTWALRALRIVAEGQNGAGGRTPDSENTVCVAKYQ